MSHKTPADVEILAAEFYGVVMAATNDQWIEWDHADQSIRSGYYDLAFEVADKTRGLVDDCTCPRTSVDKPKPSDPNCPAYLRDERLRLSLAEAWDNGWRQGATDVEYHGWEAHDLGKGPHPANPYRPTEGSR